MLECQHDSAHASYHKRTLASEGTNSHHRTQSTKVVALFVSHQGSLAWLTATLRMPYIGLNGMYALLPQMKSGSVTQSGGRSIDMMVLVALSTYQRIDVSLISTP